jgi:type VI secretion system protein ImpE
MVIQAAMLDGQGKADAASQLREQAFEQAPAVEARFELNAPEGSVPQNVNSAWVADADARLGPMLEAVVEGKYYWIPWSRVAQVTFERPTDLRDVVWLPVNFVWTTGAPAVGLMFTRYPGSEHSSDAGVRLARKTVFDDAGVPLGQRVLAGEGGEYDLLSLRSVTVGSTEVVQQALAKAAAERMKGAMEAGGMAQGMLSSMGKGPASGGGAGGGGGGGGGHG